MADSSALLRHDDLRLEEERRGLLGVPPGAVV